MSNYDDDYWEYAQDEAISSLIEQGIGDQRDEQIASYLGTYGDAVQTRVDRCLSDAQRLSDLGFPSHAVVSSVTTVELILRYFIIRPILEGAFLSEEWTYILVNRILTNTSLNPSMSLRSRRKHKAQGGAKRNPG